MAVIAITNQKGGCSKSTSAVHLACWLNSLGYKVHLVDADTQHSSSLWTAHLKSRIPTTVLQTSNELLEQIPELAAQCDYLIVDGPAGIAEPTRAILLRADLAVVPCQPTGLDVHSASEAIRLIRQAQSVRGGFPVTAMFVSRAIHKTRLLKETLSLLQTVEAILLKSVIYQKQAIADTFGQSATIWDLPGASAAQAAKSYEMLFTEVLSIL